jgi:hypothetical protein
LSPRIGLLVRASTAIAHALPNGCREHAFTATTEVSRPWITASTGFHESR